MRFKPFKDDPMMRELHERQAEYAAKVKGMTPEEELAFSRKELLAKLARDGWTLVPVKPGIMRLKRLPKSRIKKPTRTIRKTMTRAKK